MELRMTNRALWGVLVGAGLAVLAGTPAMAQSADVSPVTDEMLANPPDGDWLMWRRTYNSWGYSPLEKINTGNVANLELAWSWAMDPGNSETTPLVHDGVMYLIHAGSAVQALSADTGDLLWEYRPQLPEGTSTRHRNLAIYQDKIYVARGDAMLVALDARSGQVAWETQVGDYEKGYSYTSGPIIVKGLVVTGMTGCSQFQEDSCFITAHNADTGEEVWRTYTIARPGEPGGDTWGDLPLELRGGGDVWIPCSYDPQIDLIYCGVAQAKPWAADSRGLTIEDDVLFTNSTLALRPETGEIAWYHQFLPGESLDMDEVYEQVLVDIEGEPGLIEMGKIGVIWQINRETGAFIGHRQTVNQNIIADIDPKSGEVTWDAERIPRVGETVMQCPTHGNTSWVPSSYHPGLNLLFEPMAHSCLEFTALEVEFVEGGGGSAARRKVVAMPGHENVGELGAFSVDRSLDQKWSYEQRAPFVSGLLSTGGNLLFSGDTNRYFQAFDAATGEKLWSTRLPAPVGGSSVTYEVDGVQYVAVHTGISNIGAFLGPLTPEIRYPATGNGMFVFKLAD